MVVEKILYTDNLRNGTDKINAAIDLSNASKNESASAKTTADGAVVIADNAVIIANTADGKSESTQLQLDNIVINSGTSDAETIQARDTFPLLKDRLNSTDQQLAEKASEIDLEIERARISNLTANAGNTDGNAELLDIRVGFDGITYPTAGDATRALGSYMTEANQPWEVV